MAESLRPFTKEINEFRTLNAKDFPITMKEGEMPVCIVIVTGKQEIVSAPRQKLAGRATKP